MLSRSCLRYVSRTLNSPSPWPWPRSATIWTATNTDSDADTTCPATRRRDMLKKKQRNVKQWQLEQLELGGLKPPPTPLLSPAEVKMLGASLTSALDLWNSSGITNKVIIYQPVYSRAAKEHRDHLERAFYNPYQHPAPLRFILDIRDEVPPAEYFDDWRYLEKMSSFQEFLRHGVPVTQFLPNALALYKLVSQQPELLVSPIIQLISKNTQPKLLLGPKAITELFSTLEAKRTRQLGPAHLKILRKFTEKYRMGKGEKEGL
ncbi:hypothetical protein C8R43DRAFT_62354 [Mycena crocata]|nr:hypothetical protein C8R43DRAFT_62354 [Mycena crocata]